MALLKISLGNVLGNTLENLVDVALDANIISLNLGQEQQVLEILPSQTEMERLLASLLMIQLKYLSLAILLPST